jgi:hypothetical protein
MIEATVVLFVHYSWKWKELSKNLYFRTIVGRISRLHATLKSLCPMGSILLDNEMYVRQVSH